MGAPKWDLSRALKSSMRNKRLAPHTLALETIFALIKMRKKIKPATANSRPKKRNILIRKHDRVASKRIPEYILWV